MYFKSSIAKRKGRDKYNELLTFLKNVEKADTKLSLMESFLLMK